MTLLSEQAGIELPAQISDAVARSVLRHGAVEIIGRMPWSSNATFLTRIALEDDAMLAIYKPRDGERPLWDFPDGSLCQREVAAFELSELLAWQLVPDTVLRDGPAGIGSFARFYDHDPEQHFFELFAAHTDVFRKFAAFDVIANNTDRKGGHVLVDTAGHIWGIDHGVCFHEQPKLRTVIWEFAGEAVGAPLLADITRAMEAVAASPLVHLLAPSEVDAMLRRADRLVSTGRFPMTTGDYRDYPWPVI